MTMRDTAEDPASVWDTAGTSFARWRAGDPAALDELVRVMSPILWHVVRATGSTRSSPRTSSRPRGWRWCATPTRSATRRQWPGGSARPHAARRGGSARTPAARPPWTTSRSSGTCPRRRLAGVGGRARRRAVPAVGVPRTPARALPEAAAHRCDGATARLREDRGRAQDAHRQHRPDPRPLPRQAPPRARTNWSGTMNPTPDTPLTGLREPRRRRADARDPSPLGDPRPAARRPRRRRARDLGRDRPRVRVRAAHPGRVPRRARRRPVADLADGRGRPVVAGVRRPRLPGAAAHQHGQRPRRVDGWVLPRLPMRIQVAALRPATRRTTGGGRHPRTVRDHQRPPGLSRLWFMPEPGESDDSRLPVATPPFWI